MMICNRETYRNLGLLVLRLAFGGMMAYVGWPKITAGPTGDSPLAWANIGQSIGVLGVPVFWPAFWGLMCAIAEFAGGICVALGFLFRPALFLLVCNMIVATLFVAHISDKGFQDWGRPAEVGVLFFCLFFIGPGRFALDALLFKKRG